MNFNVHFFAETGCGVRHLASVIEMPELEDVYDHFNYFLDRENLEVDENARVHAYPIQAVGDNSVTITFYLGTQAHPTPQITYLGFNYEGKNTSCIVSSYCWDLYTGS